MSLWNIKKKKYQINMFAYENWTSIEDFKTVQIIIKKKKLQVKDWTKVIKDSSVNGETYRN